MNIRFELVKTWLTRWVVWRYGVAVVHVTPHDPCGGWWVGSVFKRERTGHIMQVYVTSGTLRETMQACLDDLGLLESPTVKVEYAKWLLMLEE